MEIKMSEDVRREAMKRSTGYYEWKINEMEKKERVRETVDLGRLIIVDALAFIGMVLATSKK